jgi:gliding motility-associated-like protein
MPSAFTPNHDGINDVFLPKYQCSFTGYKLKVFNRWGQLVFISANAGNGWDGRFSSREQPTGIYVWELDYKDALTGKDIRKTGTILLIR